MPFFRQRLAWVLGCWLVFQFAGVVAPLALAAAGRGPLEEVCMCPGGGHGAVCPMHHGKRPATPPTERDDDPRRCVIRSASDNHGLALLSLVVSGGPLSQVAIISVPAISIGTVVVSDVPLSSRAPLPAAPPPRA